MASAADRDGITQEIEAVPASEGKKNKVESIGPEQLQQDLTSMNLSEVYEALVEVGFNDYEKALHLDDEIWQSLKDDNSHIKLTKFLIAKKFITKKCVQASSCIEILLFLSHYKEEAAGEARQMKDKLFEKLKQKHPSITKDRLFLDSDNLPRLSVLLERVKKTQNVIFILTKGFFSRPWCLLELLVATNEGKNLVPVKLVSVQRGFDFTRQRQYTHELSSYLDEVNPGAVQSVQEQGFEIAQVQDAIRMLMDIIAVELNFSNPEHVLDAQFDVIISKLI